jgi:16S rRNA (uracil1498-N3)-methyltransferase
MARRMFYVNEVRGKRATLQGETARHMRRVLRAEEGFRYEISDNEQLYLGEITSFDKDEVEFEIVETLSPRALPVRLHLLAALIKFDHFEWMLEKATELGAERITPVHAARSEKGFDHAAAKRIERWRRILFESGQQARRVTRPVIDAPVAFSAALATEAQHRFWLEEQAGARPILQTLPAVRREGDTVALLIGPEGGWEDAEREAAQRAGWTAVNLGPQVLRAETAALAALAVIASAWQA